LKLPSFFYNVLFLLIGLTLAFISAWQLDIVASGVIATYYSEVVTWKLWMPAIPPFNWESTYWIYPDAYVRFFILMWIGFGIALFAMWFWENGKEVKIVSEDEPCEEEEEEE